MMDTIGNIMRYEDGEMDSDEIVSFFQELLDTGLVWRLQGHYGRTANELIEAGLITRKENTTNENTLPTGN